MNLREEILKEHSKNQTMKIVNYVGDDEKKFAELMVLFLGSEYRVTQRCAWVVSCVAEKHPELIEPYLEKIINNLKNKNIHDAVKRNTLRLLQFIDISKKLQGRMAEICFDFLQSKEEPVAVKAFGMTVLANICKEEPELANELKLVVEEQLPFASKGFLARAKRTLKELAKIKK